VGEGELKKYIKGGTKNGNRKGREDSFFKPPRLRLLLSNWGTGDHGVGIWI
jgi:hypothetical protein